MAYRASSGGSRPLAIDLFCGAGGMSLGFKRAGFNVVAGVDSDATAVAAHERNFRAAVSLERDVSKLSGDELIRAAGVKEGKLDVLVGGPPCQGFSIGGKMKATDERNSMVLHFARLVAETRPKYFVMENVYGLLEPRYDDLLRAFRRKIARAGYTYLPLKVLNATDFGVPQRRRRVFALGYRREFASPSYPTPPSSVSTTVWDAIGDLAIAEERADLIDVDIYWGPLGTASPYASRLRSRAKWLSGFQRTEHSRDTVARFAKVAPGDQDPVSRFHRLSKDGVACTLRAGTGIDRGRFMAPRPIHPTFDRCINLREAARLHSFPDSFQFHAIKWHAFRQLGNSVPPLLAEAVAREVLAAMSA